MQISPLELAYFPLEKFIVSQIEVYKDLSFLTGIPVDSALAPIHLIEIFFQLLLERGLAGDPLPYVRAHQVPDREPACRDRDW